MGKQKNHPSQLRAYNALPKDEKDFKRYIQDLAAGITAPKFGTPTERASQIYKGQRYAPRNEMHEAINRQLLKLLSPSARKSILQKEAEKRSQSKGQDLEIRYERDQDNLLHQTRKGLLDRISTATITDNEKAAFRDAETPEEAMNALNKDAVLQKEFENRFQQGKLGLFEKHPEYAYVDPKSAEEVLASTNRTDVLRDLYAKSREIPETDKKKLLDEFAALSGLKDPQSIARTNQIAIEMRDAAAPFMHKLWQAKEGAPKIRQQLGLEPKPFSMEDEAAAEPEAAPYQYGSTEREKIEKLIMAEPRYLHVPEDATPEQIDRVRTTKKNIKENYDTDMPDWMIQNEALGIVFPQLASAADYEKKDVKNKIAQEQGKFPENVEFNQPFTPQVAALERAQNQDVLGAMKNNLARANQPLVQSDAYQDYMKNPVMQEIIDRMRKQSSEHYLNEVLPNIEMSFVKNGNFHGTARSKALLRADKQRQEVLENAITNMLSKHHGEGMQSAHAQRKHQLETAFQEGQGAAKEREGQLQMAQGHDNQQKAHLAMEAAKAALLSDEAAQKQQQEQQKINMGRAQFIEEQNMPLQGVEQLRNMTNGLPTAGPNQATEATLPVVSRPNTASGLGAIVGSMLSVGHPEYKEGIRQARGGRTLRRAPGGSVNPGDPANLPIFNTPEMQALKGYQQDYRPQRHAEDPAWNYVRRVSAEILKDPRGSPMAAVGRGMEAGHKDINTAEEKRREQAIAIAEKMQDMKQKAHETMLDYQHKKEALASQDRHNLAMEGVHGGTLAEQKRYHEASEARSSREHTERMGLLRHKQDAAITKQNLAKLKPTSADLDYEKKSEERARLLEDQLKNLDLMGETVPTTKSGTILERAPWVSQSPLLQSLVNLNPGALDEYSKRHTAVGNYARGEAKLNGGTRGGIGEINYAAANKWSPEHGQQALDTLVKRETPRTQKHIQEINFERDATNYGIPRLKAKALYPYWQEEKKLNPKAKVSDFYRKAYAALAEGTFDLPELTPEQAEASWGSPAESQKEAPSDRLAEVNAEIAKLQAELGGGQ